VLKKDWGFKGWVMSDWEGTHSTVKAALNGLDQEQPGSVYFGEGLKKAIEAGQVPQARLDDMVHRILRGMFAVGVVDDPPVDSVLDPFQGRDDAQHIEEESIVLLKNADKLLPLQRGVRSIALIGSHADVGVLSGGGSAQVDPPGGNAADPERGAPVWGKPVYFPSSPLKSIQAQAPGATLTYNDGSNPVAAAALAKHAEVAIVFVNQFMSEGKDAETLSLPDDQDALVSAVAAANPNTVVILETGGPVSMPWNGEVKGIMAAWYPGIGGGQAMASLLFGVVNPSGKLPVTFAKTEADLPHPKVAGMELRPKDRAGLADGSDGVRKTFEVVYSEGVRFGYKWFDSEKKTPLYPFGYGLSYTTYAYSDLKVDAQALTVSFDLKNTGDRAGSEIAEVYVELPAEAGEHFKRLAGFARVALQPGETRNVTVPLNALTLSVFDVANDGWTMPKGRYTVLVGPSSRETTLSKSMIE